MGATSNTLGAQTNHQQRKDESANTEERLDEITSDNSSRRKEYNLFISHSWTYDQHYDNITDMFNNKDYFKYNDYSVPQSNPIDAKSTEQLRRDLRRRIENSSAVVVTSGMYLNNSTWMKAEVDMAKKTGTPVVAVQPHGNQKLPSKVKEDADKVVGWNRHSAVEAVREVTE